MQRVIGRFYFRIEGTENLIGHFSNNLQVTNFVESALRIDGTRFEGHFNSTWTDDLGTFQAVLTIQKKTGSNDIYTLNWSNETMQFWGEGFIVDDLLIGDYRNFNQV